MTVRDPAFVEREYNARAAVPEHTRFFERWEKDSGFARETLESRLDIAYGGDPRHRIDLFPARQARGTLLFVHGGYWRGLDKQMFSWLAPAWVAEGITFAAVNYRLCPQVRIADIVEDAVAAVNAVVANTGPGSIVVCGHSAGGHLIAAVMAAPASRFGFDTARFAGAVAISGIVDFEPLLAFSGNADLRLTAAEAKALGEAVARPSILAPLVVAVGALESSEFLRQSQRLAESWGSAARERLVLPGHHHFSILDALVERSQPLHSATLALFA
jgi:arylformamidase